MRNTIKLAALAIAGACLTIVSYILGMDDAAKQTQAECSLPEEDDETEEIGTDTQ